MNHPGYWQLSIKICLKAWRQVCLLVTILTKAEACWFDHLCYSVCQKLKKRCAGAYRLAVGLEYVDSNVLFCSFCWWIVGQLATFTVVNLVVNINNVLITVQLLYFLVCVSPWHSDALFAYSGRHSEEKGTDVGELIALLQLCESLSWSTKISDMLEIHLPVRRPFRSR